MVSALLDSKWNENKGVQGGEHFVPQGVFGIFVVEGLIIYMVGGIMVMRKFYPNLKKSYKVWGYALVSGVVLHCVFLANSETYLRFTGDFVLLHNTEPGAVASYVWVSVFWNTLFFLPFYSRRLGKCDGEGPEEKLKRIKKVYLRAMVAGFLLSCFLGAILCYSLCIFMPPEVAKTVMAQPWPVSSSFCSMVDVFRCAVAGAVFFLPHYSRKYCGCSIFDEPVCRYVA